MDTSHHTMLTSSELANLWSSVLADTLAICGIKHFIATVEDAQTRDLLEFALHLSERHVQQVRHLLTEESCQVPQGFTEADVDLNAPRLYSDAFYIAYIANMAKIALTTYGLALARSVRLDIVNYYSECLESAIELHNRAKRLMLEKGLFMRAPSIPYPEQIEYVDKKSFLGSWLGEQRPLLAEEIGNLVYNLDRNAIGKALIIGFSQVAQSEEVRNYMTRGRDIASKQIKAFSSFLVAENLPAPMTWDAEISGSQTTPFSDKLMMFHITSLIASGVGQYGVSASVSPRKDIVEAYSGLATEIGKYGEQGLSIMIENGWLEKPPQAVDRERLARV